MRNSLLAAVVSTTSSVIVAAPVVVFVIPLFVLFADLGLVDSVPGLTIVYIASMLPVACWMMGSTRAANDPARR